MSRAGFIADYALSAGQIELFDAYATLLVDWQARMNLVAPSTIDDVWDRHFADSAQLASLADATPATTWLDIGSGAGFPGLVLAVLAPGRFHLVEARIKKCAFLSAAVVALGITDRITIHPARIEAMVPFAADVLTARAAASLHQLFAWGLPFAARARWLLPKGRTAAAEVAEANRAFVFTHQLVPSRTAADARIVVAEGVRRRR